MYSHLQRRESVKWWLWQAKWDLLPSGTVETAGPKSTWNISSHLMFPPGETRVWPVYHHPGQEMTHNDAPTITICKVQLNFIKIIYPCHPKADSRLCDVLRHTNTHTHKHTGRKLKAWFQGGKHNWYFSDLINIKFYGSHIISRLRFVVRVASIYPVCEMCVGLQRPEICCCVMDGEMQCECNTWDSQI